MSPPRSGSSSSPGSSSSAIGNSSAASGTLGRRAFGLAFALTGQLLISLDAALLRLQVTNGATIEAAVFHKYLFSFAFGSLVLPFLIGPQQMWSTLMSGRRYVLLGTLGLWTYSLTNATALLMAETAQVLALTSLNPFWVYLYTIVTGTALPMRTVIAMLVALGAMLVIFLPEIMHLSTSPALAASIPPELKPLGLGLGAVSGVCLAAAICVSNAARREGISTLSMTYCTPLAAGLVALTQTIHCAAMGSRLAAPAPSVAIGLANGAISVVFVQSCAIAPMYISPLEVALVLLLEPALSPFPVWAVFHKVPTVPTCVGLGLLLVTLAAHEIFTQCCASAKHDDPIEANDGGKVVIVTEKSPLRAQVD